MSDAWSTTVNFLLLKVLPKMLPALCLRLPASIFTKNPTGKRHLGTSIFFSCGSNCYPIYYIEDITQVIPRGKRHSLDHYVMTSVQHAYFLRQYNIVLYKNMI